MNDLTVSHTHTIANTQLGVQTIGDIPAATKNKVPVLVFLHEALGSIPQWKNFPLLLSKATRLPAIVYERQGFGSSAPRDVMPTKDYLHQEAFEVLPQVIAHFGLQEVILVGHSDGGSIALLYAARFPDKVTGLITEAAHVLVEPETLEGIKSVVAIYEEKLRHRLQRYHGNKTDEVFAAWNKTWLTPEFASWNIESYLPQITAHTLVIQGADDKYGTKEQVNSISSRIKGKAETCWIPDCGHAPHHEQPEIVLNRMTDFIKNL